MELIEVEVAIASLQARSKTDELDVGDTRNHMTAVALQNGQLLLVDTRSARVLPPGGVYFVSYPIQIDVVDTIVISPYTTPLLT